MRPLRMYPINLLLMNSFNLLFLFRGMLSFIMYELLKHPHAYAKVREEVDRVLGNEPIRAEHISKMPYIVAVMREGLRLYPPAAAFAVGSDQDNVLAGEYFVPKDTVMLVMLPNLHRDPVVWGEDVRHSKSRGIF
jgi:cytochrome P450 / NADPH-cytochrome P450 reductase